MKTSAVVIGLTLTLGGVAVPAERPPSAGSPPPPVVASPPPAGVPGATERFVYQQEPLASRPILVSADQARAIIDRFRAAYAKLGSPRFLIYVNRELVDEQSGMKLAGRSERTVSTRTEMDSRFKSDAPPAGSPTNATTLTAGNHVTIVGGLQSGDGVLTPGKGKVTVRSDQARNENTYRFQDRPTGTLADRQTVRDIERLFGRPLRMAGVGLADQRVATQLIGDNPLKTFTPSTEGEQARKDREALEKIADVVLEILISSRNITVPSVSGDVVYAAPDIHATAIRLKDARIMGQATASDIVGADRNVGRAARTFDTREIAEATALALMEDLLMGVGQ